MITEQNYATLLVMAVVTDGVDTFVFKRRYIGYNKRAAIEKFKKDLISEGLKEV